MDYVVVSAASEAAYSAKRSFLHHMSASPRMPTFDGLSTEEHLKVAHQAAAAIAGDSEGAGIGGARWDHPDRIFWLVARIVARAMGHEVLDDGDLDPKSPSVEVPGVTG